MMPVRTFRDALEELSREAPEVYGLPLSHPAVQAAFEAVDEQDDELEFSPYSWDCPKCGSYFSAPSALFVHLLRCPAFRAAHEPEKVK